MRPQSREWFSSSSKINVVYHDEIWENPSQLPVFNSHAIEAHLNRIPGLQEHFIYFNDDMFLGREIESSMLFSKNGEPVVHAHLDYSFTLLPSGSCAYRHAWKNLGKSLNVNGLLCPSHVATPMTKTLLSKARKRFGKEWENTMASRFRNKNDIPPIGAATNFDNPLVSIHSRNKQYLKWLEGNRLTRGKLERLIKKRPYFVCFNNGTTNEYYKLLEDYFNSFSPKPK
jgi:hypothetical protein